MSDGVIDLAAARARRDAAVPKHPILEALDTLAVALTDHHHVWSGREVALYETAVGYILNKNGGDA